MTKYMFTRRIRGLAGPLKKGGNWGRAAWTQTISPPLTILDIQEHQEILLWL